MSECLTKRITDQYSGCLKEEPHCQYAAKFGFSYHCQHPDHLRFAAAAGSTMSRLELNRRYRELRELRRRRFIADLGMPINECVSRIVGLIKTNHPDKTPSGKKEEE